MTEVWILGGTGRSGRAIAAELRKRGIRPVLVGRDADRLAAAAEGDRVVVAASVDEMAAEISRQRPAVVVNTVGPFSTTAAPLARACLPASHYLDLANDLASFSTTLALDEAAATAGRTIVTGAGFGVTATESVVVKLCEGRPTPEQVRVDMIPSLAMEEGVVGEALAGTFVEGIPGVEGGGRYQGRRYRDGRLAPARLGDEPTRFVLPDGATVTTSAMPLGELVAAQRASGAPDVLAASSEVPSSPVARTIMRLAMSLLAIGPVRTLAKRQLAAVKIKARPQPREYSWGHAVVRWADGTEREGWLRVGEAQAWTGVVPAEVVHRLLTGQGKPGFHTPAALFGSSLAEACGGEYFIA
ncbi:short subunit dehydrogenase-like uncharacterized protein [Saccharothrix coeruleofusca]|uniref:hypothetical protein n=1 Tax=Saccharothrix coeruleofusca TaxID=33919 RepID=UPI001AE2FE39|nr:hypothetical protein [Saccharothrix coeruleofusca]MBP2334165.1 short subunit dehydrogenase-like uncharacterized protein [Saccharothrix coeruleofusca]